MTFVTTPGANIMLSNQSVEPQSVVSTEARYMLEDHIYKLIENSYLEETDLYCQRLKALKSLESRKQEVITFINKSFDSASMSLDDRFHKRGEEIRELRESLKTLAHYLSQ